MAYLFALILDYCKAIQFYFHASVQFKGNVVKFPIDTVLIYTEVFSMSLCPNMKGNLTKYCVPI